MTETDDELLIETDDVIECLLIVELAIADKAQLVAPQDGFAIADGPEVSLLRLKKSASW